MKKSRIFLAAGSLALAISAVFATKANKKFSQVSTGKGGLANNYEFIIKGQGTAANFTTAGATLNKVYAYLYTTTSKHTVASAQLFTVQNGTVPILWK
jgi:hypothetical protein